MSSKANFFLCVFGPDGSGKSAVYSELSKIYSSDNIAHFHWRPGFLPYKVSLSEEIEADFMNPHRVITKPLFKSYLIFLYIYIDFIIGYFLKVANKNKEIIYYERYFYDLIVDQKRYGIKVSPLIIKFCSYFVKKPDLIVILDAEASILYKRKQELTVNEIERQRKLYRNSVIKYSEYLVIDVGKNTPKEVVEIILNRIN